MTLSVVIMCGGSGTRLWPSSLPARPKQFLPLFGTRSLFEATVDRAMALDTDVDLTIVTGTRHRALVEAQLAGRPARIILEPEGRDSGPAMTAAAMLIARQDPSRECIFLASDHHIPDDRAFAEAVAAARRTSREGRIVLLGIEPAFPSTAYGYIKPDGDPAPGDTAPVSAFYEKPDSRTAEGYVAVGFLWNSGNFISTAATLIDEVARHVPAMHEAVRDATADCAATGVVTLPDAFRQVPKQSIDYAVMERTDRASVVRAGFDWSDLGTWSAVHAAEAKYGDDNNAHGATYLLDTKNSLVRAGEGMEVAIIGGEDLAVVADGGRVLVTPLSRDQEVKEVAAWSGALRSGPSATGPSAQDASLHEWADQYRRWLTASALPIWATLGIDQDGWGAEECLDHEGMPHPSRRRARVQVRQAVSFATGGRLGWPGPWQDLTARLIDDFDQVYRREDGLYRTLVEQEGSVHDDRAFVYDQAFVLLALSACDDDTVPDAEARAKSLLERMNEAFANPAGGFREEGEHPCQANCHMHMFEAASAWAARSNDRVWRELAEDILDLAETRFFRSDGNGIGEFYDDQWRSANGGDGSRIEPGHQFEWAWLLARWSRFTGNDEPLARARDLYRAGTAGIDPDRNVAVDWIDATEGFFPREARLWPQTERLKAALLLSELFPEDGDYREDILHAAASLWRYLETPVTGLWYDRMKVDGQFRVEPVSASTFYHLTGAVEQLLATAAQAGR